MVQRLLHDQEAAVSKAIPEDELRKYYQDHLGEYVRPERIRVSHIFLAAEGTSPKRGQVGKEAVALLADLKKKEAGPLKTAFADGARSRSDDATSKPLGGDLNFKTRDELAQAWGSAFADAAEGLKVVGEIGAIVSTDKGFHLIKLMGRQPGLNQTLETVRPTLEARLRAEHRTRDVDAFVSELREKANVRIHDDELAKINVPVTALPSVNPTIAMPPGASFPNNVRPPVVSAVAPPATPVKPSTPGK